MHNCHRELRKVFCSDKTLELPAKFSLKVARDHVSWEGSIFVEALEYFCDELCLVRWLKGWDDLFDHGALTIVVNVISSVFVFCIPW